jgi:Ca2+-binding RTX toxin-like protein
MATLGFAAGSGYGNPFIDSLIWGGSNGATGKWTGGPITYYFASGSYPDDPADSGDPSDSPLGRPWLDSEKDAFTLALQLYENVCNVQFQEVFDPATANMRWWLLDEKAAPYLGRHQVPSGEYGPQLDGIFNYQDSSWSDLTQGGFGFITVIHELGHGLGLAHPHDGGSVDHQTFPGVKIFHANNLGTAALNQGIFTTMSYNDGWRGDPGVFPHYGYQGTPMAFDIAALQTLYGANTTYHAEDGDIYALPGKNASGTFWSCIWDAGGAADEISADGLKGACKIDLNAATLTPGDPAAGGSPSWVTGIHGGFTIAHGVVIENATGGNGADTLIGNDADNLLKGNSGSDSLTGGIGTDTLDGGAGADKMAGGSGDDLYRVDDAKDVAIEIAGDGSDTVASFASYVLGAEIEVLELQGNAAIAGTGNVLANTIVGNTAANTLDGGLGADTLQGGLGNDLYIVDDAGDKTDETGGGGVDTVKSLAASYVLNAGVENLTLVNKAIDGSGNELANIILGTTAGNTLSGLDGNDSLSGDKGDDTLLGGNDGDTLDGGLGNDSFVGGAGNDTYRIDVAGDKIDAGADAGTDTVESMISFILGAQQENLTLLGTGAINGTGNDAGNIITGNTGANILDGGSKGESDTLIGGAGNDTYLVDASGDRLTELDKGGTDLVKSAAADYTLDPNVENLTLIGTGNGKGTGNELANLIIGNGGNNTLSGLDGNDTLTGNDGGDSLDGGKGNDAMTGGNGDDTYVVDSVGDKVTEGSTALAGHDTVKSTIINYTLGANVEDLDLSEGGAINGTGNALLNLIIGSAAANILDGKAGADTLQGGGGDDTYVIDSLGDEIDETGGGGKDTIQIATAFDLLAPSITIIGGAIENVTLTGKAVVDASGDGGANDLTGNAGANKLTGLGGDDTLDGMAGADTMIGGTGNDTYVVDNAKDVVQEEDPGDTGDVVKASIAIDLTAVLYDNIEDVVLTGTGALKATGDEQANHLTGNTGANLLTGNAGADTLIGDAGNDTLLGGSEADSLAGGAGNDSLDGGASNDSMAGGLGNDTYLIDDPGNVVTELDLEGTDTERSSLASLTLAAFVENLVLLAGAVSGTGNGLNNTLTGNELANTLDGGIGADTLVGGKGDDSYLVDDAKDVVTEAANAGTDTVTSTAASYTLGGNVENLVLDTGAHDGTGNALSNAITGNGDANTLDGKAGADHMSGGGGADTYVVDNVKDVVDEGTPGAGGTDTVNSSIAFSLAENGTTVLGTLENLTLTGTGAIAGTGNDGVNHIIGNSGANKLLGAGGADILEGGAGADTLDGGAGNDSVTGGAGNDRIDVGDGDDTVFYNSKLDGKDIIDNFQGGGHDVLNLAALFDTLNLAGNRADHVSIVDNGASVDVRVDADGKASNGAELVVATLNTNDTIVVNTDIILT